MLRPTRRLVAACLWLAIALLPLRAVGMVWMQSGMGGPATAAATAPAAAMPCHGGDAAADGAAASHHVCQLCDLCHAGVTVAPDAPTLAPAPAAPTPDTAPTVPPGGVAPDGLFRPPR
jgi:hypothetical protein